MSLTHCPLCVVLALLSTARGLLHALQLWQLLVPAPAGASLLGRGGRRRLSLGAC